MVAARIFCYCFASFVCFLFFLFSGFLSILISNKNPLFPQLIHSSNAKGCFVGGSHVIELQTHSIVHLIVHEADVVLVDVVPFLNSQLFVACSQLGRR